MNSKEEIFNKAKKLHLSGNINGAKKLYLELIEIDRDNFLFQNLLGTTLLQLKKYDEAIKHFDISIKLNPSFAASFANKGIAHAEKKQYQEAISNYDKAINLKKNFYDAYLNKGIALKNIHKYKDALKYFEFCIKINHDDPKIYSNLGNLFLEQKSFKEALKAYDKAISLQGEFAEAYSNRGEANQQLGNFKQAIADYAKALKINNNLDYVHGKILHAKMHINDWKNFDDQIENLKTGIKNKKKIIPSFPLLALIDDPKLHKKVAIKHSKGEILNITHNRHKSKKIKLGYFSADFRSHPVLELMLDVFKNHDKSLFEIYGFYHYSQKDEMTNTASKYFDKFFYCADLSDNEIADLSRNNNIDIAIDLTGYTANGRNNIYCYDPAPIKINYLGYPGTMGSACYDYIIADEIVLPKSENKNFVENVIHLPECYLPNQAKIEKIDQIFFTKKDLGLPEDSLVFGSLHNNYKITPHIFNSWMKILKNTKNSILWLLQNNDLVAKNINLEAQKHGIEKNRIFFAKRVSSSHHIQRLKVIDLFLDTFPYNAHITAQQAIRMGVPVLTIKGRSFASRVASSILNSVNLQELITTNINSYTNLAIEIANNKKKLKKLKDHLSQPKIIKKLNDTKKFTKDFEKIFIQLSKKLL